MNNIRVLVVDDSAFMRKVLIDYLNSVNGIEVCGFARDGEEALDKVKELKPDVITLDVSMPKMDGLTALSHIMKENPTPVIMVSSLTVAGAQTTLDALEFGAVDFISKPKTLGLGSTADEIAEKINNASKMKVKKPTFKLKKMSKISFLIDCIKLFN